MDAASMAADEGTGAPEGPDWTAQLPTSVLAHILSLLPLISALLCGTLSKSWMAALQELLARATALDFGPEFSRGLLPEQYSSALDRILALHKSPDLHRLRIFFHPGWSDCQLHRAMKWVEFAASKSAKELEVGRLGGGQPVDHHRLLFVVPAGSAFLFKSLADLSLIMCSMQHPIEALELPVLQRLSLRQVLVRDGIIRSFLNSCPLLAMVKVKKCYSLVSIKISLPPSLSSLTIMDCPELKYVEIDAPMLKSFYFYGRLFKIVLKNVSSLEDAYIDTIGRLGVSTVSRWDFLPSLSNVTTLTLYNDALTDIGLHWLSWMPLFPLTFHKLKTLQLIMMVKSTLEIELHYFLYHCRFPVLENLLIELAFEEVDQSSRRSSEPVIPPEMVLPHSASRLLCIRGFNHCTDPLRVPKFFLERDSSLETLVLVVTEQDNPEQYSYTEDTLLKKLESYQWANRSARIVVCRPEDCPVDELHAELHTEVLGLFFLSCQRSE